MQQIKLWKKLCLASVMVSSVAWASNTPPTITSTPITSVLEDGNYSYTLTATDGDGDALNWSVTDGKTLPSWLSLDKSGTWEAVGTVGFSEGGADYISIAFDSNNTPYVIYQDYANSDKATVQKFNGTAWEAVGTVGFSEGVAYSPSIAFDSSDTPYVVYRDYANSQKATVQKFNGTAWEAVGTVGFSEGRVYSTSIAFNSSDTPYVVYKDYANSQKATVQKFNGSAWEAVGTVGFSEGEASSPSIAFDSSDTPYVVYKDDANSKKATVQKFNGTAWEAVGTVGFSEGVADYTSIAIDSSDTLYVVYQDDATSKKATVQKFNGSAWEAIGTVGFSEGKVSYISLAFDSSNTPYVVYTDNNNKATVQKFNGSAWEAVGTVGFSEGAAYSTSIAFDSSDTPYVVYQDNAYSGKVTVQKFLTPIKLTGTPTNDDVGVHDVNLTLSDGTDTVSHSFQITVTNVNYHTPTITSTPITSILEDGNYSYTLTATDSDGDDLNWSVTDGKTLPSWLSLEQQTEVTTLAGSNSTGSTDGNGSEALFNYPFGVATDSSGNIFVADYLNHKIRKITPSGVVTTLAGSSRGFANGTGSEAQFNLPNGVATDSSGNIFVTDQNNHKIRKITPSGEVTTFAGSSRGFANGTGSEAQFKNPSDVAIDSSGNIFVADKDNHKIRKITPSGVVTTLAGSSIGFKDGTGSEAQFNTPYGVATDSSGNIFVADKSNHKIRKITPSGVVTTLAGSSRGFANGTGSEAQFTNPTSMATDSSGNIFVADNGNHAIRKITPSGEVTTLAGSGSLGSTDGTVSEAQFNGPIGVATDSSGNIFVADMSNHKIRKITPILKLKGTPTNDDVGVHDVNLTLSDGTDTVSHSFQITVTTQAAPSTEGGGSSTGTTEDDTPSNETTGSITEGGTTINFAENLTGNQTMSVGGNTIQTTMSDNGESRATMTLSNGHTSTVVIKNRQSQTNVDSSGNVKTTLSINDESSVETQLNIDGTVTHRVSHRGIVTESTSTIQGATVTVDENGSVETTSEVEKNGFKYRAVVTTNTQGETTTKFIKTDLATGEEEDLSNTLKDGTSFESGNNPEVVEFNDLIYIKVSTSLDNNILVIE